MKKISTKLNISMLLLTVLTLAFVGIVLIINMSIEYHREFETRARQVFDSDEFETAQQSLSSLQEYMSLQLDSFHPSCDYYILESSGNIIKSSKQGGVLAMTNTLARLIGGEALSQKDALDCAAVTESGFIAYILDSKKELYDSILEISFLLFQAIIFAVILAAVISFIISKRLTRSIKLLESGARQMSEGTFEKISVRGNDEIASLCTVFNEMGAQIQKDYDEFERVEKSRREFVANVSHELKTPLTVIKSYSETLASLELDKDTQKEFIGVIGGEVDRMSDMVSKLLQLSKLGSPVNMPKQSIDLYGLCREITLPLSLQLKAKDADIKINGSGSVFSEKERVKTILTNLISNAVKYCESGSEIVIDITDKKVTVTNEGPEISKEELPRIFERFYRTDPARSRETGGTGLGLAIAKESAELIGAKLSVKSCSGVTAFTLEF